MKYVNCLIIGPPGSGKGARGVILERDLGFKVIATGQLCRDAVRDQTPIGERVKEMTSKGQLVSDEVIGELLLTALKGHLQEQEALPEADRITGFCFDGFPRRKSQCAQLKQICDSLGLEISFTIQLDASFQTCCDRILGRLVHLPSGRTYHEKFAPPKRPGLDDETGEPLTQRSDDTEETLKYRYEIFLQNRAEVLDAFKDVEMYVVDANLDINDECSKLFAPHVDGLIERARAR